MRKVTVYSTKGKSNAVITTDVATWGELQPLLVAEGYDLDSLNATENINRTDLINTGAVLPEGEFTLFLRPKQTKSGLSVNMSFLSTASFKELRELIKNLDAEGFEEYKEFLREVGHNNWTQLSTQTLRDTLTQWLANLVEELEEEEELVELEEDCTHNTVEVLNSILSTLNCVATTQQNDEINERVKVIFDEIVGIQNAVDETKVLKLAALDAEALEILKGYRA